MLLSTRFYSVLSDYITSIFYAIDMMLFSTIVLLMFLESRTEAFSNKLFFLSAVFLILFFSSIIAENLLVLTPIGINLVETFSIFFLLSSVALMLLSSLVLSNNRFINNAFKIVIVFIPLIVFTASVLISQQLFSSSVILDSPIFKFFIIAYVYVYGAIIFYNIFNTVKNVLTVRYKFVAFIGGLFIVFTSSGLRVSNTLLDFTSMFSLIGSFTACLALLLDSNLSIYSYSFSKMINNLSGMEKRNFISYLNAVFSRNKKLVVKLVDNNVIIKDSLVLNNIDERRAYDKLLLQSIKWYRRNVRSAPKFIKEIKQFFNTQVLMAKKLSFYSI